MTEAEKSSSQNTESNQSWWPKLVEAAALIAVPSVLAYILGFLAIWIQIATEYSLLDPYNIWFVVSLIPKELVVGKGISTALKGLGVALPISGILFAIFYFARFKKTDGRVRFTSWLYWFVMIGIGVFLWASQRDSDTGFIVTSLQSLLVPIGAYAGLVAFVLLLNSHQRISVRQYILSSYPKYLYICFVLISIGSITLAPLFPTTTTLPCLWSEPAPGDVVDGDEISAERAAELEGLQTPRGGLIAHDSGYWYVIGTRNLNLQAIPDSDSVMVIDDQFETGYTRIGEDGKPKGLPEPEDERQPSKIGYELSGYCG